MPILIETDLPTFGCVLNPAEFREIVAELHRVMYPDWTDEELKNHLDDARAFVNAVRSRCQCMGIPDHLILRTLSNMRKRSKKSGNRTRHAVNGARG